LRGGNGEWEGEMTMGLGRSGGLDADAGLGGVVGVVSVRHDGIEAIIAAGQFDTTRMRPFSAARAAVCAQAGPRVSTPAAPNARLPKPARRKSRRPMPPRRENTDVIGASLVGRR